MYIFLLGYVHKQRAEVQTAQLAYEMALRDGYVNVYRGQIKFVGQDRAGKTSLKKTLLGLPFDPKEQSTEVIEVNTTQCEIEIAQVKNWHSTQENKPGLIECSKDIARMVTEKVMCLYSRKLFAFGEGSEGSNLSRKDENYSRKDQV